LHAVAYTAQRVNFPYDLALSLARQYQALAGRIESAQSTRQRAKHLASEQWQGKFSSEFDQRMSRAATGAGSVAGALRREAAALARAWADAHWQQQVYLYYAMVQHKKDNESFGDKLSGIFGDGIDTGNKPPRPQDPLGPGFAPTQVPQAHVPGESPPPMGDRTSS